MDCSNCRPFCTAMWCFHYVHKAIRWHGAFFKAVHSQSFRQSTVTLPIKMLLNLEVLLMQSEMLACVSYSILTGALAAGWLATSMWWGKWLSLCLRIGTVSPSVKLKFMAKYLMFAFHTLLNEYRHWQLSLFQRIVHPTPALDVHLLCTSLLIAFLPPDLILFRVWV